MRTVGLDANALRSLQASAGSNPRAAIAETAKQFESLFMQELMKSMRQATLASGMLDNSGTKMGTELLDSQLAQKLTGLPGGLSAMIARQLERQVGGGEAADPHPSPLPKGEGVTRSAPQAQVWNRLPGASRAENFIARHSESAEKASADTGIPAAFILSQAALESGWGKRDIRHADGSASHNLFGIKAGANWKGAVAEVTTTEYIDGEPRKVTAKFRAYVSPEESFRDYAQLIKTSPRYAGVVEQGGSAQGFATGLQRAGYATDPAYADKLGRVINTTLRLQRDLTT
ncbi:flagellar assembly peptidoglycan hydrolase FlgJ [Methylibium sp.]|uniref:flagellar assembly peptidoglycan hydrolase FlgJ n=1 Tax=Methylibium sp. TaxID=2067992 RepID=UPI00181CAD79|nr:flagellar assembly peptidoglycan hydrolase FlgJ [Methylibium sp.]MBA3589188.1 flagellar assembly peptidoglycan hydrolase FlgJ [Methylibium sp.]